jgi:GT2 family glycosyltransferase
MAMTTRLSIIVPSLGRTADAEESLERLRAEMAGVDAELIWVTPADVAPPPLGEEGERGVSHTGGGFAVAANRGIAAAAGEAIALVNDDAWVEPHWLARLLGELDATPSLSSVQGVHLVLAEPELGDGCGIGWSRDWQAVQLGHREPAPPAGAPFEVFGVSATAAIYRRAALEEVASATGQVFDESLGSWYEDVDLAVRLRAQGWSARCVPTARVRHRGSATGATMPLLRARLLARNRWLVLARTLGRAFPTVVPRAVWRDLRDLAGCALRGELRSAVGTMLGLCEAAVRLRRFAHRGPALLAPAELTRLRLGSRP